MQPRPRNVEEPEEKKRIDDAKNLELTIVVERDYGPISRFEYHHGDLWEEEMEIDGRVYFMGLATEKTVRVFMSRNDTEYKLADES